MGIDGARGVGGGPSSLAVFVTTCACRRKHDQGLSAVLFGGEVLAQGDLRPCAPAPRATAVAKVIPRDPLCWPPQDVKDHIPPRQRSPKGDSA